MFTRQQDIIYGRKHGMALTMDVFTPGQNANGIGLIWVVSGGWVASHEAIETYIARFINEFIERGYTVFAVVPSSQPKYSIPEIIEDVHRAVRFIRHHAGSYGVDAGRLGIGGGSAGGHLSLMVGFTGRDGAIDALDPVDACSSAVQAVVELYAPTDFLNYGAPGSSALGNGLLRDYKAPFDFSEFDESARMFVKVTDMARYRKIVCDISPINHVKPGAPPTLVIHGDQDLLVPLQQSQVLVERLELAGVWVKLDVVPGAGHGWENMSREAALMADWFDEHLRAGELRNSRGIIAK